MYPDTTPMVHYGCRIVVFKIGIVPCLAHTTQRLGNGMNRRRYITIALWNRAKLTIGPDRCFRAISCQRVCVFTLSLQLSLVHRISTVLACVVHHFSSHYLEEEY